MRVLVTVALTLAVAAAAPSVPTPRQRAQATLANMTLEEKITLLGGSLGAFTVSGRGWVAPLACTRHAGRVWATALAPLPDPPSSRAEHSISNI